MTFSYTTSATFTRTDAVYLGSKVAADLRQMQRFYGYPPDDHIDAYIEELVILVVNRCLKLVEYGFKRGDQWAGIASRYVVGSAAGGVDERSGRIPAGGDIRGAAWHSYLEYNDRWWQLTAEGRNRITASLPITRTPGEEPRVSEAWVLDRGYARNGVSLQRGVFSS